MPAEPLSQAQSNHTATNVFCSMRRSIAGLFVEIENAHRRALLREALRNGPADSAGGAGDDGDLAVKPERIAALRGVAQRETPRFQGMKSFCARSSALV